MHPELPESSALVYVQEEAFLIATGEPIPLERVACMVVATADMLYAEALSAIAGEAFAEAAVLACGVADALPVLRAQAADFLVLGLGAAEAHELELLQAVARERLARRVFVVSARKDELSLQSLRAARFDGFLDPVEGRRALVAALRQVADGRGYLSPSLCRRMFAQRSAGVLVPLLTPAELQVFSAIGDGSSDAEAAARLGLSQSTVATHRKKVMRKLGVSRSAKLVREAVRLGVVRILPEGEVLRPGLDAARAQRAQRRATAERKQR